MLRATRPIDIPKRLAGKGFHLEPIFRLFQSYLHNLLFSRLTCKLPLYCDTHLLLAETPTDFPEKGIFGKGFEKNRIYEIPSYSVPKRKRRDIVSAGEAVGSLAWCNATRKLALSAVRPLILRPLDWVLGVAE